MSSKKSLNLAAESSSYLLERARAVNDIYPSSNYDKEDQLPINGPPIWNVQKLSQYRQDVVHQVLNVGGDAQIDRTLEEMFYNQPRFTRITPKQKSAPIAPPSRLERPRISSETKTVALRKKCLPHEPISHTSLSVRSGKGAPTPPPSRLERPRIISETKTVALRKKCLLHETISHTSLSVLSGKRKETPKSARIPLQRFAGTNRKDVDFAVDNPGIFYDKSPDQKTLFPRRYFSSEIEIGKNMSSDDDMTSVNVAETVEEAAVPESVSSSFVAYEPCWKDILVSNAKIEEIRNHIERKNDDAQEMCPVSPPDPPNSLNKLPSVLEVITTADGHIRCEKIGDRQKEIQQKCDFQRFPALSIRPERQIQKVASISIAPDLDTNSSQRGVCSNNVKYMECVHEYVEGDFWVKEQKQEKDPNAMESSSRLGGTPNLRQQQAQISINSAGSTTISSTESSVAPMQLPSQQRRLPCKLRKKRNLHRSLPCKNFAVISSDEEVEHILKNAFTEVTKPQRLIRSPMPMQMKEVCIQTDAIPIRSSPSSCSMVDKATSVQTESLCVDRRQPQLEFMTDSIRKSYNIDRSQNKNSQKPLDAENSKATTEDDLIVEIFDRIKNDSVVEIPKFNRQSKNQLMTSQYANQHQKNLRLAEDVSQDEMRKEPFTNFSKTFNTEAEPLNTQEPQKSHHTSEVTDHCRLSSVNDRIPHAPRRTFEKKFRQLSLHSDLDFIDDDLNGTDYTHLLEENPEFAKTINRIKSSAARRDYTSRRSTQGTAAETQTKSKLLPSDKDIQRAVNIFLQSLHSGTTIADVNDDINSRKPTEVFLPELPGADWCSDDRSSSQRERSTTDLDSDSCSNDLSLIMLGNHPVSSSSSSSRSRRDCISSFKNSNATNNWGYPHHLSTSQSSILDIRLSSADEKPWTASSGMSEGEVLSVGEI